jgi:hypothetical protein
MLKIPSLLAQAENIKEKEEEKQPEQLTMF